MKSQLKYLFSTALLTAFTAGAMFTTGCGPSENNGGGSCTFNEDCEAGEICDADTNTCVPAGETCTTSADCGEGEFCINAADNSGDTICGVPDSCSDAVDTAEYCEAQEAGTLCLPAAEGEGDECRAPADCSEAADVDAYCSAELNPVPGQSVSCNTDGETPTCELGPLPTEVRYISIVNAETSDASCVSDIDGTSDAGADIGAVQLLNANGEAIGWGRNADYRPGTESAPEFTNVEAVFDGAPKSITDKQCPEEMDQKYFRDDTAVSLGCDAGALILDFQSTSSDEYVVVENDQQVVITELGPHCEPNGMPEDYGADRYNASLCETEVGADPTMISIDDDCTYTIMGAEDPLAGVTSATLSGLPEPVSANNSSANNAAANNAAANNAAANNTTANNTTANNNSGM